MADTMSPISLNHFSGEREGPLPPFSSFDASSRPSSAANFGTDWAFDEALGVVGANPDRDHGFVSDWALPSAAVAGLPAPR